MSRLYYIILLLAFIFLSCRKAENGPVRDKGHDMVKLAFRLTESVSPAPKTYTLSGNDESLIKQIILLAFKVEDGHESFAYYREGMQIYAGSSVSEYIFYADLPKSMDEYRFVVLTNGGQQISNAVAAIAPGTEKNIVMQQLVYTIPGDDNGKWKVTPNDFTPLPMWGECSTTVTGINALTILPPVHLLRSLSRVDIRLSGDALAAHFFIVSIHLYNARTATYMAPLEANFDAFNLKVTGPSTPPGTASFPVQEYLIPSAQSSGIDGEIYLLESGADPDPATATAMVIGLDDHSGSIRYYRIDFLDNGNVIPILRNHRYSINIIKVNNPGQETPSEAFETLSRSGELKDIGNRHFPKILAKGLSIMILDDNRKKITGTVR